MLESVNDSAPQTAERDGLAQKLVKRAAPLRWVLAFAFVGPAVHLSAVDPPDEIVSAVLGFAFGFYIGDLITLWLGVVALHARDEEK